MAGKNLLACLHRVNTLQRLSHSTSTYVDKIGNRDVVGFGINGTECYIDRFERPMPAIRFKENTPDVMALREKEKGDWKKLSIHEKKELYRASFCQTLAEMDAPTGEWKSVIGLSAIGVAIGLWLFIYFRLFVYPPLPESFNEENRVAQMKRMLALEMNPVEGISSKKNRVKLGLDPYPK
ncbi:cytochrome c oxidase subunit 4 isoform 1, mitochondrial-like [Leptopilina boulardi]|uniref:cytochrome c oxidase subunit 4 isoform 1, mitochondrial-like n=1 Tax=Leptopilina boulardi TaxID=63433 RepID=UPI0021F532B1|nr:cytochrome c oxidase subunit 4 isoform 1, mitochondrial-like [Leptopilina boulardi]